MLNIAPIAPTPKKKDTMGQNPSRKDSAGEDFAELLRRAAQEEQQQRHRHDGFVGKAAGTGLHQTDMSLVRHRVQHVNEEILALLR